MHESCYPIRNLDGASPRSRRMLTSRLGISQPPPSRFGRRKSLRKTDIEEERENIDILHVCLRARLRTRARETPRAILQYSARRRRPCWPRGYRVCPWAIVPPLLVHLAKRWETMPHGPTRANRRRMPDAIASDRYFQALSPAEGGGNSRVPSYCWLPMKERVQEVEQCR